VAEARHVSSRDNPLLVRVRKLGAEPGAYRKLGELWLEGDHLCAAFAQRGGRALQAVVSTVGWEQPALRALAHNGGESARAMRITAALGLPVHRLPSTSPAHASWSFERKLAAWRAVFQEAGLL